MSRRGQWFDRLPSDAGPEAIERTLANGLDHIFSMTEEGAWPTGVEPIIVRELFDDPKKISQLGLVLAGRSNVSEIGILAIHNKFVTAPEGLESPLYFAIGQYSPVADEFDWIAGFPQPELENRIGWDNLLHMLESMHYDRRRTKEFAEMFDRPLARGLGDRSR